MLEIYREQSEIGRSSFRYIVIDFLIRNPIKKCHYYRLLIDNYLVFCIFCNTDRHDELNIVIEERPSLLRFNVFRLSIVSRGLDYLFFFFRFLLSE